MAASTQSPSSDVDSVYAMSDDEEGGYDTVRSVQSGRGVKLLFSKSKVGRFITV